MKIARREFTVRKATREDADEVLQCLHRAFEPYREHYTSEAFADTTLTKATLLQRMEEMTVLIAISDAGVAAGTIACQVVAGSGSEGHIRGMAALPEWHGRGVAAALLDAAEGDLRAAGCLCVTLDTTAPLQRAVRFYERNGFAATGREGDFFGMPFYEYKKLLSPHDGAKFGVKPTVIGK